MNPRFLITLVAALLLVTFGGFVALNRLGVEPEAPSEKAPTVGGDSQAPKPAITTIDPSASAPQKAVTQTEPAPLTEQEREVWDTRISDLLIDESIEHREAGQKLAAIAAQPDAPEEVRVDAIQHALNLIGDEEYIEDLMTLAVRTDLPEEMQEIIFSDLHNRPQEISVPVAKEIGRLANHPLAQEARDFVEFFEDDDFGDAPGAAPVN